MCKASPCGDQGRSAPRCRLCCQAASTLPSRRLAIASDRGASSRWELPLLQRQTGGGIAETLSNLGGIIRQRKALRMKARALTAEAQASAALVATTPFVAGVGLFLINRDLITVLFFDPRGRFMLGIAVASLLTGIAGMRALIKRYLR